MTTITLEQACEILKLPPEAMLGIIFRDDRVSDGDGPDWWLYENDIDDPVHLRSPWCELRDSIRNGQSKYKIAVHLRSVSRGIDAICYI